VGICGQGRSRDRSACAHCGREGGRRGGFWGERTFSSVSVTSELSLRQCLYLHFRQHMLESVPEILLFGRRVPVEGVLLPVGHRQQRPPRSAQLPPRLSAVAPVGVCNVLDTRVAVAFSSASSELRALTQALPPSFREALAGMGAAVATALFVGARSRTHPRLSNRPPRTAPPPPSSPLPTGTAASGSRGSAAAAAAAAAAARAVARPAGAAAAAQAGAT